MAARECRNAYFQYDLIKLFWIYSYFSSSSLNCVVPVSSCSALQAWHHYLLLMLSGSSPLSAVDQWLSDPISQTQSLGVSSNPTQPDHELLTRYRWARCTEGGRQLWMNKHCRTNRQRPVIEEREASQSSMQPRLSPFTYQWRLFFYIMCCCKCLLS